MNNAAAFTSHRFATATATATAATTATVEVVRQQKASGRWVSYRLVTATDGIFEDCMSDAYLLGRAGAETAEARLIDAALACFAGNSKRFANNPAEYAPGIQAAACAARRNEDTLFRG